MTQLLLISGSTREGSTNTAALRTAASVVPEGATATLYGGLVSLPAFVPGDQAPPAAVTQLREAVETADAVLFCTPEYAGTLPGSLKNLLDWLVGSGELNDKPVAWLSVAAPGRGEGARTTLETVLRYVDAKLLASACARVPVPRDAVAPDGGIADQGIRAALAAAMADLVGALDAD
ncbi:NAD(P)H-dependent oxidoreductase [Micromonospora sp. NPDC049559]|uniref:NADPH-dependent FMN reductase n=1 Tax=Micromonospora sp. NPDC049559 TaxID=3155923 RepID=UPI0034277AFB